jgi:hypothetical protein
MVLTKRFGMRNKYIGLDLGQKGAIVIRHNDEIESLVMPLLDGKTDFHALRELFLEIASELKVVYLEEVFAGPQMSRSSALSFGKDVGRIEGILLALNIPFKAVRPQAWQKVMLAGVSGSDTKVRALKAAQSLFPGVELLASSRSKIPHSGIVDALLISEYARRQSC